MEQPIRNGPQVPPRGGEEARGETASRTHVVVVDDDPAMRNMIAQYLDSMSFRVSGVADGNDVTRIIEDEAVDLIILDLKLEREDGLDLMRRLGEKSDVPGYRHYWPAAATRRTGSSAWSSEPTTTSRSRSACASWSRACVRCCGAREQPSVSREAGKSTGATDLPAGSSACGRVA